MNSVEMLQVVRLLLGMIELAREAGVDIEEVVEAQRKARAEGRDLTDEELEHFRQKAQASIDAAREA